MKRLVSHQLSMLVMTVALFAGTLLLSGTASAQTTTTICYPTCTTVSTGTTPPATTPGTTPDTPPTTSGFSGSTPSSIDTGTAPAVAIPAPASSGSLAFTGVDVAGIVVVAVVLIAGGFLVLRVGRRRRQA